MMDGFNASKMLNGSNLCLKTNALEMQNMPQITESTLPTATNDTYILFSF